MFLFGILLVFFEDLKEKALQDLPQISANLRTFTTSNSLPIKPMEIQYLGQNCFLISHNGYRILTDPFYNFGKENSGFEIDAQKIDYVLITHSHEDHVADVQEVLEQYPQAVLLATPEICGYYKHPHNIDFNIGGSAKLDGLAITMVRADHTSSFADGSHGGVAVGYILRQKNHNVYLAGDTGVMADMALFEPLYGAIDVAILPIGGHYTMCARKAAYAAAELIKTKKVIACHFDTFAAISINHEKASEKFAEKNIELILPKLGESFTI
jgi:L-ascorbate metabolism protein UlaG (beta-lactamase superfamily)